MLDVGLWLMDVLFPLVFTLALACISICAVVWSFSALRVYRFKKTLYNFEYKLLLDLDYELKTLNAKLKDISNQLQENKKAHERITSTVENLDFYNQHKRGDKKSPKDTE